MLYAVLVSVKHPQITDQSLLKTCQFLVACDASEGNAEIRWLATAMGTMVEVTATWIWSYLNIWNRHKINAFFLKSTQYMNHHYFPNLFFCCFFVFVFLLLLCLCHETDVLKLCSMRWAEAVFNEVFALNRNVMGDESRVNSWSIWYDRYIAHSYKSL